MAKRSVSGSLRVDDKIKIKTYTKMNRTFIWNLSEPGGLMGVWYVCCLYSRRASCKYFSYARRTSVLRIVNVRSILNYYMVCVCMWPSFLLMVQWCLLFRITRDTWVVGGPGFPRPENSEKIRFTDYTYVTICQLPTATTGEKIIIKSRYDSGDGS